MVCHFHNTEENKILVIKLHQAGKERSVCHRVREQWAGWVGGVWVASQLYIADWVADECMGC